MRIAVLIAALATLSLAACEQGGVMGEILAQEAARKELAVENAKKGKDFLAANAAKAGVKTTPSGLQYEVVRAVADNVPRPTAADNVAVNYEGKLIDGTTFDSSYARGQTATFPLGEVIPAWTEGVQLMKPGEEFLFTVPPELGYGAEGAGADIGPNQVLIFKVELLGFQRAADGAIIQAPGQTPPAGAKKKGR